MDNGAASSIWNAKGKITAPVLKYSDFTQEFIMTTDASDYAIGAVLSQGKVGNDRLLTPAEY